MPPSKRVRRGQIGTATSWHRRFPRRVVSAAGRAREFDRASERCSARLRAQCCSHAHRLSSADVVRTSMSRDSFTPCPMNAGAKGTYGGAMSASQRPDRVRCAAAGMTSCSSPIPVRSTCISVSAPCRPTAAWKPRVELGKSRRHAGRRDSRAVVAAPDSGVLQNNVESGRHA